MEKEKGKEEKEKGRREKEGVIRDFFFFFVCMAFIATTIITPSTLGPAVIKKRPLPMAYCLLPQSESTAQLCLYVDLTSHSCPLREQTSGKTLPSFHHTVVTKVYAPAWLVARS